MNTFMQKLIMISCATVSMFFFPNCGSSDSGGNGETMDSATVSTDTVWKNRDIHVTGTLVVNSGATLTI